MSSVTLRAYAKINISLDVVGKREDGYHLLESVFQGISLYDEVQVTREEGNGGIRITCNLPYIPTDGRNIVYKVAEAFFQAAGIPQYQVKIHLNKTIPTGAGLGGGSANGAAVFSALCRLYKTSFSVACSKVPNSVQVKGLKPMTIWKDRYFFKNKVKIN
jgi:4-diphosphocytidyl-2-C-methyl-D-erythritol kinase